MTDQTLKDIDRAFKALEERDELLDKIKAEINTEIQKMYMFRDYTNGLAKALEIIDKYRKEQEC